MKQNLILEYIEGDDENHNNVDDVGDDGLGQKGSDGGLAHPRDGSPWLLQLLLFFYHTVR
jgi:hypothetical protein